MKAQGQQSGVSLLDMFIHLRARKASAAEISLLGGTQQSICGLRLEKVYNNPLNERTYLLQLHF